MKRASRSHGTLLPRFVVAIMLFSTLSLALAQAPSWWQERGVLKPSADPDPLAAVNQAQLMNTAKQALEELRDVLPAPIKSQPKFQAIETMVAGFNPESPNAFVAVNQAQAKNIAAKFYDLLIELNYSADYPWANSPNPPDPPALINQAQVKNLFKFDVGKSTDGDSIPDWWEMVNLIPPGVDHDEVDSDGDGTLDIAEYNSWTNPKNYYSRPGGLTDLRIELVSGNNQESTNNEYLGEGLSFKVIAGANTVLLNAPVEASVVIGDGGLSSTNLALNQVASLSFRTDPTTGIGTAYYKQGATVAEAVTIEVQAGSENAFFSVNAPWPHQVIEIVKGDKQGLLIGNWTWRPIKIRVKNLAGDPLATNVEVSLETPNTGGIALTNAEEPQSTLMLSTDLNGEAEFWFKAGNLPGAPTRIYIQPPGHEEDRTEVQLAVRNGSGLPPVTDGLMAWYAGEQNANDSWGLNHATENGSSYGAGSIGSAFDFDGVADYLQTPVASGEERTLAAWIKPRTSDDVANFEAVLDSSTSSEIETGFGLDNGAVKVSLDDQTWPPAASINLNEWQHVAVVFSPTEAKLYINGTLAGTESYTQGDSTNRLYRIGSSLAGDSFDGLIDEVGVYERALTAAEIGTLYNWSAEPPVADPLTVEMKEDYTAVFNLTGTSSRGLALNVQLVSTPEHGTVTQVGSQITYIPDLNYHGPDGFAFQVTDQIATSELAAVLINIESVNDAPWVLAGANQSVVLPASAALAGQVTDVDQPADTVTYLWKKEAGPGDVTFADATALATQAQFSAPGEYALRLSAFDGNERRSDTMLIVVAPEGTVPPAITISGSTTFTPGAPIVFTAPLADEVTIIEIYEGSRKIGETTTGTFTWTPTNFQGYLITALAVGSSGSSFSSGLALYGQSGGFTSGGSGNQGTGDGNGSSGGGGAGEAGGDAGAEGVDNPDEDSDTEINGDPAPDGLTNAVEAEIGTDPTDPDTDGDDVVDGLDGWAGGVDPGVESLLAPARLPVTKYAVIDLGPGYSGTLVNDAGQVVISTDAGSSFWERGTTTPLADNFAPNGMNNSGTLVGSKELWPQYYLGFKWSTASGLVPLTPILPDPWPEEATAPLLEPDPEDESTRGQFIKIHGMRSLVINDGGMIYGRERWSDVYFVDKLYEGTWESLFTSVKWTEGTPSKISDELTDSGDNNNSFDSSLISTDFPEISGVNNDGVMVGSFVRAASLEEDGSRYFDSTNPTESGGMRWDGTVHKLDGFPCSINEDGYIMGSDAMGSHTSPRIWFPADNGSNYKVISNGIVGKLNNKFQIASGGSLWQNYARLNLNDLVSESWSNVSVRSISDNNGLIVGKATKVKDDAGNAIPPNQQEDRPVLLLPIEIVVPQMKFNPTTGYEEYVTEHGSVKLKNTDKLQIGTLEFSFESTAARTLKADWIDQDPDRFYIRVTDPGHSGQGPIKVRVWTESDGTDYDDDDRTSADANVVELIEEGTTGIFKSKAMLLTSNDGDDDQQVDGIADGAKNDRTRKIALEGKLKVELLAYKQAPEYKEDIAAEAPIEKTVQVKFWIAKVGGTLVFPRADVENDFKVAKETFGQAGVKLVANPTIVEFSDSDAGIALSGPVTGGLTFNSPEANLPDESKSLFNWIDAFGQRENGEISVIYVNFLTTNPLLGANLSGGTATIAKKFPTAKFANHILMGVNKHKRYILPHELLHILLNAVHDDYQYEFDHIRMSWSGGDPDPSVSEGAGILGRKRVSKRAYGKQTNAIKSSKFAK